MIHGDTVHLHCVILLYSSTWFKLQYICATRVESAIAFLALPQAGQNSLGCLFEHALSLSLLRSCLQAPTLNIFQ